MAVTWTSEQLALLDTAPELRIAARGVDGALRAAVPIWVVTAGGRVYVRSWHRRETGWFGAVVRSGRARVSVPGLEIDVRVEDLGAADGDLRASVDRAYRAAYGGGREGSVAGMVTDDAAATTLRLVPEAPTA